MLSLVLTPESRRSEHVRSDGRRGRGEGVDRDRQPGAVSGLVARQVFEARPHQVGSIGERRGRSRIGAVEVVVSDPTITPDSVRRTMSLAVTEPMKRGRVVPGNVVRPTQAGVGRGEQIRQQRSGAARRDGVDRDIQLRRLAERFPARSTAAAVIAWVVLVKADVVTPPGAPKSATRVPSEKMEARSLCLPQTSVLCSW